MTKLRVHWAQPEGGARIMRADVYVEGKDSPDEFKFADKLKVPDKFEHLGDQARCSNQMFQFLAALVLHQVTHGSEWWDADEHLKKLPLHSKGTAQKMVKQRVDARPPKALVERDGNQFRIREDIDAAFTDDTDVVALRSWLGAQGPADAPAHGTPTPAPQTPAPAEQEDRGARRPRRVIVGATVTIGSLAAALALSVSVDTCTPSAVPPAEHHDASLRRGLDAGASPPVESSIWFEYILDRSLDRPPEPPPRIGIIADPFGEVSEVEWRAARAPASVHDWVFVRFAPRADGAQPMIADVRVAAVTLRRGVPEFMVDIDRDGRRDFVGHVTGADVELVPSAGSGAPGVVARTVGEAPMAIVGEEVGTPAQQVHVLRLESLWHGVGPAGWARRDWRGR